MMNNRTVFLNGMRLLLWGVSRQRSRKWMLLSFLGYVAILYGVFVVGGNLLLTHGQIVRGFLGFHGGGVMIGIVFGAVFWLLGSMALAVFLICVPDREGAYAPFRPIMVTLLSAIVLLCCAWSGWWLAMKSVQLSRIQADEGGGRSDEGRGRREDGMMDGAGKEGGISAATVRAEHPGTEDQAYSGSEEGPLTLAPKIAIFDLKEMAIFAVFALVVAAVVAFSLILQPFG